MVFQQLSSHCRSVESLMCDCPLRIRDFSFPVVTRFHRVSCGDKIFIVSGKCKLKTRTHMEKLEATG